jgi:hypothetical protein
VLECDGCLVKFAIVGLTVEAHLTDGDIQRRDGFPKLLDQ